MECTKEKNLENCTCSYLACAKRGLCCQCVTKHLAKRQVPGCFFNKEGEATYDRSFEHFAKLIQENKI